MTKKILVIDDEPNFLEVTKVRLEANNYSVVTISDAKEVLQTVEKEVPDIILLDIVMPNMDGYLVCEQLKQGEITRNIPIILLSGKDLEPRGINERCIELGVEDFLIKPVDTQELLGKIEEVLKKNIPTLP